MKKYVQLKNLESIFDASPDFFKSKIGTVFFEGVHFFPDPSSESPTKKVVFWDVEAVDNWLRGRKIDKELDDLLSRRSG